MEPGGDIQRDFRRPGGRKRRARGGYDRRDAPQSASYGGEPAQKGAVPRRIGRTKGGLNSKLHAVCNAKGKPLILLLSEGQASDYKGADQIIPALPPGTKTAIGDRGYDSDKIRNALRARKIKPCIPGRRGRKRPVRYDKTLYKQRNVIERMFARLKDWRRVAMRYDRCAHTFFSAIVIAATVSLWL